MEFNFMKGINGMTPLKGLKKKKKKNTHTHKHTHLATYSSSIKNDVSSLYVTCQVMSRRKKKKKKNTHTQTSPITPTTIHNYLS